ncbi:hypothetical protein RJ55_04410 [Drechmeria coniospora]|nr:hypothetical protein RJ55_04410 [Drechmeria coniospora]
MAPNEKTSPADHSVGVPPSANGLPLSAATHPLAPIVSREEPGFSSSTSFQKRLPGNDAGWARPYHARLSLFEFLPSKEVRALVPQAQGIMPVRSRPLMHRTICRYEFFDGCSSSRGQRPPKSRPMLADPTDEFVPGETRTYLHRASIRTRPRPRGAPRVCFMARGHHHITRRRREAAHLLSSACTRHHTGRQGHSVNSKRASTALVQVRARAAVFRVLRCGTRARLQAGTCTLVYLGAASMSAYTTSRYREGPAISPSNFLSGAPVVDRSSWTSFFLRPLIPLALPLSLHFFAAPPSQPTTGRPQPLPSVRRAVPFRPPTNGPAAPAVSHLLRCKSNSPRGTSASRQSCVSGRSRCTTVDDAGPGRRPLARVLTEAVQLASFAVLIALDALSFLRLAPSFPLLGFPPALRLP